MHSGDYQVLQRQMDYKNSEIKPKFTSTRTIYLICFSFCFLFFCCCCCCFLTVGGFASAVGIAFAATTETERIGLFQTFGKWNGLPLNEASAINRGWKIHTNLSCEGSVYYLDNKTTTGMIYDTRGLLAGVQVGIEYKPNNLLDFWHQDQLNGQNFYNLKLYFINESEICGERNSGNFGNVLKLKKISNGFITFPNSEKSQPFMDFKKGSCAPFMGVHYWFQIFL